MAGHSKFKNIMYRKGAQDKKRGKLFTKVNREITVAVKEGGPDPTSNPRLRAALGSAKAANMPKENVERAIKKATSGDEGAQYEEMRYEGYGPGGVAIIVEVLTDNRNRTASEIRSAFTKHGGNLGETNSVSFQFERLGSLTYPVSVGSAEAVFEAALEAGAQDVESSPEGHEITCVPEDLHAVAESLTNVFNQEPQSAKLIWHPQNTLPVTEDQARSLLKLLDTLEDNDDVQNLFANYEMEEALFQKLQET